MSCTPYGIALTSSLSMKSCTLTCSGSPAGRHSAPPLAKAPTSLLLRGVRGTRRLPGGDLRCHLLADVGELGIAVRVLAAFQDLGIALQRVTSLGQQPAHGVIADRMPAPGQLTRQRFQRQRRPPQRRLRLTPRHRLPQSVQPRRQPRIDLLSPLTAPARTGPPAPLRPPTATRLCPRPA